MISLNSINKSDRSDLHSLVSNYNVMKYVGARQVWQNNKINRFIDYCIEEKIPIIKIIIFLKLLTKNQMILLVLLVFIEMIQILILNSPIIFIKKQGKGIGSKALQMMLDKFHKNRPDVKKVVSDTLTYNIGAQKSLKKSGFLCFKK